MKYTASNGREYDITQKHIMLWNMADAINGWLMKEGDVNKKYCIRLDLVCDVVQVLEKSLEKTAEQCLEHGIED